MMLCLTPSLPVHERHFQSACCYYDPIFNKVTPAFRHRPTPSEFALQGMPSVSPESMPSATGADAQFVRGGFVVPVPGAPVLAYYSDAHVAVFSIQRAPRAFDHVAIAATAPHILHAIITSNRLWNLNFERVEKYRHRACSISWAALAGSKFEQSHTRPRPPFMRGYSIIPWERRAPTATRRLAAAGPTGVSLRTIPWPKSLYTRDAPNLGGIHLQGTSNDCRFTHLQGGAKRPALVS